MDNKRPPKSINKPKTCFLINPHYKNCSQNHHLFWGCVLNKRVFMEDIGHLLVSNFRVYIEEQEHCVQPRHILYSFWFQAPSKISYIF